jgi:hypothetical protein
VDELDRHADGDRRPLVERRREEDEERPQALAAGQRVGAGLRDRAAMPRDRRCESFVDLCEVLVQARRIGESG